MHDVCCRTTGVLFCVFVFVLLKSNKPTSQNKQIDGHTSDLKKTTLLNSMVAKNETATTKKEKTNLATSALRSLAAIGGSMIPSPRKNLGPIGTVLA